MKSKTETGDARMRPEIEAIKNDPRTYYQKVRERRNKNPFTRGRLA